jgi:DNA primase
MSPEPIIALDGDTAGLRAAMRVIDMALPLLEAGRSVRFALMPEGKDPDDVLKAGGIDAMRALIDASVPMVDLLWRRETERKSFDSPERRAALDAVLRSAVAKITDGSIRGHYVAAIREKRREMFTVPRPNSGFFDKRKKTPVAVDTTRSSTIARVSESQVRTVRESVVLAICLTHSDILHDFETRVETMHFDNDGHKAIHRSILHHMLHPTSDLLAAVSAGFPDGSVEKLMLAPHVRIVPAIRKSEDKELARQALIEELDKLDAERGMQQELADAVHDMESFADEGLTWRLSQASAAKANALKSELDEAQEVGEDRQEMSKHLQNLIDGEVWVKKKK